MAAGILSALPLLIRAGAALSRRWIRAMARPPAAWAHPIGACFCALTCRWRWRPVAASAALAFGRVLIEVIAVVVLVEARPMNHARIGKKVLPRALPRRRFPDCPRASRRSSAPPGAGKTLILKTLAGFATPDSGRILVDDAILFDAASRVNLPASRRRCV